MAVWHGSVKPCGSLEAILSLVRAFSTEAGRPLYPCKEASKAHYFPEVSLVEKL